MTVIEAFGDIAGILAGMDPVKILELRAPAEMGESVEALVNKKKEGNLSPEEAIELERYLSLDLLINLAKARAKGLLAA